MLQIRVAWPNGESETFSFEKKEITIGRSREADLSLRRASGISRKHARLFIDAAGVVFVEDLGSTNGTVLNDKNVSKSSVEPHDSLEIGDVKMRVSKEGAKEKALEKYPLDNKGVSKLKQISVEPAVRTDMSAIGESRMTAAISSAMPKLWELVNRPNVQSVVVDSSKTIATFVDGQRENAGMLFEEKDLEVVKRNYRVFLADEPEEEEQVVSASLQNGLTISIVSAPVNKGGIMILLEKSFVDNFSISELSDLGAIEPAVAEWLESVITAKKRVLIASTNDDTSLALTQSLSKFIPNDQGLCVIDSRNKFALPRLDIQTIDPSHLKPSEFATVLRVNAKAGVENYLIDNMSSEYGGWLLRDLASGTAGCIASIRASSVDQALSRMELTLSQTFSGASSKAAMSHEIASAVDTILFLDPNCDSVPRIRHIVQIQGVTAGGDIELVDVYDSNRASHTTKISRSEVSRDFNGGNGDYHR